MLEELKNLNCAEELIPLLREVTQLPHAENCPMRAISSAECLCHRARAYDLLEEPKPEVVPSIFEFTVAMRLRNLDVGGRIIDYEDLVDALKDPEVHHYLKKSLGVNDIRMELAPIRAILWQESVPAPLSPSEELQAAIGGGVR